MGALSAALVPPLKPGKVADLDASYAQVEDQFDFHTYCVRKMTLRAYVRMLRLEDHVWGHRSRLKRPAVC